MKTSIMSAVLEVFGPDYVDLLPDNLHPDAEGYRVMERIL